MEFNQKTIHRMPFFHTLAASSASHGLRGSRAIWKIAYLLKPVFPDGTMIKLSNGFVMEIDSKDWTSRTIYEGTYERALLKVLSGVNPRSLVIDVGANIGVTLWRAISSNSKVSYLAFEPATKPYLRLSRFLREIENTGFALKFGLSDQNGFAHLYGEGNLEHSGLATFIKPNSQNKTNFQELEIRMLDSVMTDLNLEPEIDLIKIDVEGYEGKVLSGAEGIIAQCNFRFLVLEVSPEFGKIDYLQALYVKTGHKYSWFEISEYGKLKKRPCLIPISLNRALSLPKQWNLILIEHQEVMNLGGHIRIKKRLKNRDEVQH